MTSRAGDTIGASAAAAHAAAWREGLDAATRVAQEAVDALVASRANLGTAQLQGFFAEEWHAHTLSIDAFKKGIHDFVVTVPASTGRGSPDIIIDHADGQRIIAQLKYYKTPLDTAKQLWDAGYSDTQFKIVPADQAADVVARSAEKSLVDAREHVREAARHSVDRVTDRVSTAGAESRPLTRHDSEELTRAAQRGDDVMSQLGMLSAEEVAERVAIGGATAAGIGAALTFAPFALRALGAWYEGDRERAKDLLSDSVSPTAKSAAWAGVQGAMATALIESARGGALGPALAELSPGAVGAIAVVVVQSLRDGHALYTGKISAAEFALRCTTTSAVAAGSVAGAALGQALIPIPVLGSLIGSVLGGLVARGGIAALTWSIEKVSTLLSPLIDRMSETLFGWQLLNDAKCLSQQIDSELNAAHTALAQAMTFGTTVLPGLVLRRIDIEAIHADLDVMEAELCDLEVELASLK